MRHWPGSADVSLDSFLYLSAHWLTVNLGGGFNDWKALAARSAISLDWKVSDKGDSIATLLRGRVGTLLIESSTIDYRGVYGFQLGLIFHLCIHYLKKRGRRLFANDLAYHF